MVMKKLLAVVLILAVVAAVVYYNWNRKTSSLINTDPVVTLSSSQLYSSFEQDETEANKKFLNQVVEVNGKVREIRKESNGEFVVTLDGSDMFGVICRMEPGILMEDTNLTGRTIALKGLCTGMLMDVVMVQCVFAE